MSTLLEPVRFGAIDLANRVVTVPMTCSRTEVDGNATDLPAGFADGRAPERFDPRTLYTPSPLVYTELPEC